MSEELIEKLSELEHNQWLEWSSDIDKKESLSVGRRNRWIMDCWKPYNMLSEEMKEHDRVWARKVYALVKEKIEKLQKQNKILMEACEHYAGEPFKTNDIYLGIFDLFTIENSSVTSFDSDKFSEKARQAISEAKRLIK